MLTSIPVHSAARPCAGQPTGVVNFLTTAFHLPIYSPPHSPTTATSPHTNAGQPAGVVNILTAGQQLLTCPYLIHSSGVSAPSHLTLHHLCRCCPTHKHRPACGRGQHPDGGAAAAQLVKRHGGGPRIPRGHHPGPEPVSTLTVMQHASVCCARTPAVVLGASATPTLSEPPRLISATPTLRHPRTPSPHTPKTTQHRRQAVLVHQLQERGALPGALPQRLRG